MNPQCCLREIQQKELLSGNCILRNPELDFFTRFHLCTHAPAILSQPRCLYWNSLAFVYSSPP